ncbi:MAG: putative porin [Ginsengibacter sp.]
MTNNCTVLSRIFIRCLAITSFVLLATLSYGQRGNILGKMRGRTGNMGSARSSGGDSLKFEHRDDLADSITITFRYMDSLKTNRLDSSLNDFSKFFSVPANYITLGNNGSASYPILFTPILKAGWDVGFHAYDGYRFFLEDTRFYKTTKPFTQLTYLLASGKEQMIKVLHTQNIKPNWNFGFDYRLITAPGFFKTQNTNHNNYRLFSNYQGRRKRYAAYFELLGNKITASENGGIVSDTFLSNKQYKDRIAIPVHLGGDPQQANVFSTKISTGNLYKDFTFFLRQSYDFGKKDSIEINDSTTEYLFYPKLRFQHTFNYSEYSYQFQDTLVRSSRLKADSLLKADSIIFKQWYDTSIIPSGGGFSFFVTEKWKVITNDFVIRQFPETKNPAQFLEAGLRVENLSGTFSTGSKNFYNVAVHGEYRNKTRNKKWDAIAKGELFVTGLNAGDYSAFASLTRTLSSKLGDVEISFQNVNRSPSFIFEDISSFNFKNQLNTKNENMTVLTAAAKNPFFTLWFRDISMTNYSYFKNYYQTDQYSNLINIIQAQASKKFKVSKHLNLYSDVIVQQTDAAAPIAVPFFYTRQRLALEGLFFKNLNLSTGIEGRYYTPFKAYNYSPVMGRFFPQDTVLIKNRPDLAAFFHFRIKSFTGLLRFENLNTVDFSQGFGFTHNNFAAPNYATPGLVFRIGVQWNFVN